jgi:hypothetical protein
MAAAVGLAVLAVAGAFAATIGAFVATGQIWGPLAGLVPMEGARGAFLSFMARATVISLLIWVLGLLVAGGLVLRRRLSGV